MLQKCAFVLPSALSGVSSTSDQQFFRKSSLCELRGKSKELRKTKIETLASRNCAGLQARILPKDVNEGGSKK